MQGTHNGISLSNRKNVYKSDLAPHAKYLLRRRRDNVFSVWVLTRAGIRTDKMRPSQITQEAWRAFREMTGQESFASVMTMRRWFDSRDITVPKREQVYRIAFALELTLEELNELLTEVLQEPAVCYNDYSEIFFAYALENALSYEEACQLISEFEEKALVRYTGFLHTHSTDGIVREFFMKKDMSQREFMDWMLSSAGHFKGYSLTTLDYLNTYKELILSYVRRDAKKRLDGLLLETNFVSYAQVEKGLTEQKRARLIHKYIANYKRRKKRHQEDESPDEIFEAIIELNKIAYTQSGSNRMVLSEIYGAIKKKKVKSLYLTEKRMSDLLNQPLQKEREVRIRMAMQDLEMMPEQDACPRWIMDLIDEHKKGAAPDTAGEARSYLETWHKEQKRRSLTVKRNDILPMIHYICQRKYMESLGKGENYRMQDALRSFVDTADAILASCGMAKLDAKRYFLDAVLVECFQSVEMYYYSDLLEEMNA